MKASKSKLTVEGQPEQEATTTPLGKPWHAPTLVREHLTVAISGFLVAFALLKILVFTRGNYSIALAVLNTGQQFTILASTMFNLLVIGAVLFITIPMLYNLRIKQSENIHKILEYHLQRYIPLFAAWALLLIAAPAYYLAFTAVVMCWGRLVARRRARAMTPKLREPQAKPKRLKIVLLLFSANAVALVVSLAWTPWTPQENVAFSEKGHDAAVSAYVIGQQGKQLLLVRSDRSSVRWVSEDAIKNRTICASDTTETWISKPILGLANSAFSAAHTAEKCLPSD